MKKLCPRCQKVNESKAHDLDEKLSPIIAEFGIFPVVSHIADAFMLASEHVRRDFGETPITLAMADRLTECAFELRATVSSYAQCPEVDPIEAVAIRQITEGDPAASSEKANKKKAI